MFPLDLHTTRTEVEEALQATTEMLSQVTRLLALVSAPPLEAATIVRVEVLLLQPNVVDGRRDHVGGRRHEAALSTSPSRSTPASRPWAGEYLNETVAGLQLGTRLLRARVRGSGPRQRERAFLAALRGLRSTELVSAAQRLYVGGAAGLLGEVRAEEIDAYRSLFELVEKRAALLDVLGAAARHAAAVRARRATSSSIRRCARSRSSARRTASCTAPSAQSASSARCGWTTRRPSAPSVRAANELSRFVEYDLRESTSR